jgi:hypothetical protein
MKGHKAHHHRTAHAKGGMTGVKEWEEDLSHNPESRDNAHEIDKEAEAKKHGGKVRRPARKHGGHVHHEHGKHLAHAKHLGHVHGEHAKHHAGRKPRKAGGRTGCDMSPLSSAHKGKEPKAHRDMDID